MLATTENWLLQRNKYLEISGSKSTDKSNLYIDVAKILSNMGLNSLAINALKLSMELYPRASNKTEKVLNNIPEPILKKFDYPICIEKFKSLRVLYIAPPNTCHYGVTTMFDGLVDVVGIDNIVEYPRISGTIDYMGYPERFNTSSNIVLNKDQMESQLIKNEFDFILYFLVPDVYHPDIPSLQSISDLCTRSSTPLYIIEQQDDFGIDQSVLKTLNIKLYFKREMLMEYEYPDIIKPMPLSYQYENMCNDVNKKRTINVFWSGQQALGRNDIINTLKTQKRLTIPHKLNQTEYIKMLRNSNIGLNLHGGGFDTVRYYELPSHGAFMITQQLPIHIPNKFEDLSLCGVFNTLNEFIKLVDYYLNNISILNENATRALDHAKKYHSTRRRACELLTYINHDLNNSLEYNNAK